ncbi:MAG: type II toxin-antitoxin system VapC family toxin [Aquihabitans sp.]
MIVLDASAVIELVLSSANGQAVARRIDGESLHAPQLLLVEAVQVLRRLTQAGLIAAGRAAEAVADLQALDVEHYDHTSLLDRVWGLRHNLTAYDAVYVALAEALDAPLLTFDERLANAPGNEATIELPTVA